MTIPEKFRLPAIAAAIVLLLLLYLFARYRQSKLDQGVVIAPVSQAVYLDHGKPALDDEVLHGQTVTTLALPGADGLVAVRTQYGYQVSLPVRELKLGRDWVGKWRTAVSHVVITPQADVAGRADLRSYPPLASLPRGSLLAVVGKETEARAGGKEYAKVQLADGRSGFVRPESLREIRRWNTTDPAATEAETRQQIVADALSYQGVEYRWGGKTPAGIDCSGLASMAYMLSGLDIFRNSRPQSGYPIALLYVKANAKGGFDPETLQAGGVKPGDLIYWSGHMAVYLGGGKYVHANGTSYNVRVNSLYPGDPDYREDIGGGDKVYAWGTAWPAEPNRLKVRELRAVREPDKAAGKGGGNSYRFYAKAEGYAPTRAIVYPEGYGEGNPRVETENPRYMLYDAPDSPHAAVPRYRYPKAGVYRPAVELVNATGWRPEGEEIRSEIFVMPEEIRID